MMIFEKNSDTESKLDSVREHMNGAKVRQEVRWLVEHLLSAAWSEQERLSLEEETVREAIDILRTVSRGHRIVPEAPDEVWIPAKNGILVVGDTVRVRGDAYDTHPATLHNGRVGRITAMRYGDIHVYYNALPEETIHTSVRHKATELEKRIR